MIDCAGQATQRVAVGGCELTRTARPQAHGCSIDPNGCAGETVAAGVRIDPEG